MFLPKKKKKKTESCLFLYRAWNPTFASVLVSKPKFLSLPASKWVPVPSGCLAPRTKWSLQPKVLTNSKVPVDPLSILVWAYKFGMPHQDGSPLLGKWGRYFGPLGRPISYKTEQRSTIHNRDQGQSWKWFLLVKEDSAKDFYFQIGSWGSISQWNMRGQPMIKMFLFPTQKLRWWWSPIVRVVTDQTNGGNMVRPVNIGTTWMLLPIDGNYSSCDDNITMFYIMQNFVILSQINF